MKSIIHVLLFLTALAPLSLNASTESSVIKSHVCIDHHAALWFELENISAASLSIDASSLPWVWWYGSKIDIEDQTSGKAVEQIMPIEDPPPPTRLTVQPNKTFSGHVDLNAYFAALRQTNRDHALSIKWVINVKTSTEQVPVEGTLTVPAHFFDWNETRCNDESRTRQSKE